jgi:hypothetical protein
MFRVHFSKVADDERRENRKLQLRNVAAPGMRKRARRVAEPLSFQKVR